MPETKDIVDRLRNWDFLCFIRGDKNHFSKKRMGREAADEIDRLRADLATRTAERDEARQWVCQILANPWRVTGLATPGKALARDFAEEQGWDCLKEVQR
jgi:hypothetical protein